MSTELEFQIDELLRKASGVSIDSRTAQFGEVFFAISGENFNGNRFAAQALESGCIAAIVDDPEWMVATDSRYILVNSGLLALQEAAARYRRTWQFPVLGLTGSNGKTTSKELIRDVLASELKVQATVGNFNNEIGVPLTILRMRQDLDVAVLEMGANAQNEIRFLVEMAMPTHALITNIGEAHLEGFGGPDGVKAGKSEIYSQMRTSNQGIAFAHAAHPNLLEVSEGLQRILYGTDAHGPEVRRASGRSEAFEWRPDRDAQWRGPIATALEGDYNLENIATALAVAQHFGISPEHAEEAIATYQPSNNRSEWRNTGKNRVLLDAYNANPSSMKAALRYFGEMAQAVADDVPSLWILGEMGELGDYGAQGHRAVAESALLHASEGRSMILFVGTAYAPALANAKHDAVVCFPDLKSIQHHLEQIEPRGHLILLKGSRTMALEKLMPLL